MPSQAAHDAAVAAETLLREAAARDENGHAFLKLGNFLRKRGRLADAESALARSVELAPLPNAIEMLALVQYEQQRFAECESSLERLVALMPEVSLSSYRFLAKLKATRLGETAARDVMARALAAHPGETGFVAAYAATLPPDEAIAALERHLAEVGGDPGRRAYILLQLTYHRAPILRKARALPASGTSWADTLQWPDPENRPVLKSALREELASGSRRAMVRYDLANVLLSESAWTEADALLGALRAIHRNSPADFLGFGASFHAALDEMDHFEIVGGLPAVRRLRTPRAQPSEATVFMASDPKYFAMFTLPFLRQLDGRGMSLSIHVHLLDGEESAWRDPSDSVAALRDVDVTLTAEASGASGHGPKYARNYYHAVRYVRFYEELQRARRPMWIFDCDVELLRDPRPFLSTLKSYDIAVRSTPAATDAVLKFTASSVGIAPSDRGFEFARRLAAYIVYWKDRGTWGWGVDQAALFSCYAHMVDQGRAPHALYLDDTATNERHGDSGAIRFLPGIGKFAAPATRTSAP